MEKNVYAVLPILLVVAVSQGKINDVRFGNERKIYFEGDIMLEPFLKAGSSSPLWHNRVIPYLLHRNIRNLDRQAIHRALQDIESKTCVRFKPRRKEKDYVWVTNANSGCFSYVGRSKRGSQQLNLGPGCMHKTTIIHEFTHAIGFWHEQSRQDRDGWITVQWKNIRKDFWSEFQKRPNLNTFGTSYDYRSVMHYPYNAFSKDRSRPTITTKQKFDWKLLGAGDYKGGLTKTDALQINRMYGCTNAKTLH